MGVDGLRASEERMRAAGLPQVAIDTFGHYYRRLADGEEGLLPESSIEPVGDLPALDDLESHPAAQREALDRTVIVKLNGGLGTSMGLRRAKSLLPVRDGLTFLDVIAGQVKALRERAGARLPLVLMNSFHTRADSLARLERHGALSGDLPPDFVQSREPKITVDGLEPVSWPPDPELEWCPPGHGDLYTALVSSGMLETMLDHGYRYLFVSNVDNLGATLEPRILGWMAAEGVPFLAEQCERTAGDRKGGHLARRRDGPLVLRETAQTPDADRPAFEDISRHRYFNTNSLWLHLPALADLLAARGNVLGLPMIRNRKTVDPTDPSSPAVYQLETAMGAAISVFDGARAVVVPRARFLPVKTTNDLLALRSDCYELTGDHRVVRASSRTQRAPHIDLDPDHYRLLDDFDERFPAGVPSLVECRRLVVRGDIEFGARVVVRGSVELSHPGPGRRRIADGAVLEG